MKLTIKLNKPIFLAVLFFAVASGFGFLGIEKASAYTCTCLSNQGNRILAADAPGWSELTKACDNKVTFTDLPQECKDACANACKKNGYEKGVVTYVNNFTDPSTKEPPDICGIDMIDAILSLKGIKCILLYILKLLAFFVSAATSLFTLVVDAENLRQILNNPVIYTLWRNVRDTLNVAFILTLLFSAFCTVFQIDKYNYKKILLTLIIMALLVNFSFPITRVIIDFSNVIMYYFIQGLNLPTGSVFTDIANNGGLQNLMNPGNGRAVSVNSDLSFLLAAIVFLFIFATTLIIIAVLFLIRIVVLAILIIFSSIAFVGSIVPFLSTHASKWWDTLFKYAFFGPIMIFMMSVALKMTAEMNKHKGSMDAIVSGQATAETANTIAAMAFFSIPIVILWIGIGFAQSMSIAGAGAVVGRGQKFLGWSARNLTGYRAAKWYGKELKKDRIDPIVEAWKTRRSEIKQDKRDYRKASTRDLIGSVFDRGKKDPEFYRNVKKNELKAKYKKEQELFSKKDVDMVEGIQKLEGKKDMESQLRMQAFFQTMAENKDLNEFEKLRHKHFNPYAAKDDIAATMAKTGMNDEEIGKALHDLEDISLMQGVYSMFGLATKEKGKWRKSTNDEQKDAALGKIKNIDFQKFMINIHPDSVIIEEGEDKDPAKKGTPIGIHDIGEGIIEYINTMNAKYIDRPRGDFTTKVHDALKLDTVKNEELRTVATAKVRVDNPVFNTALNNHVQKKNKDKETEEANNEKPKIEISGVGSRYSSRGKTTF